MSGDFLDTNVVLSLLDDGPRADRARDLLSRGGTISVQVLNEALVNCRRKAGMDWDEAADFLAGIRALCDVVPLTEQVHDIGSALCARHGFSPYDGMIVAAALTAGCDRLLTEDMQHGREVEGMLTIENPFL